jgi:hypothetical protein
MSEAQQRSMFQLTSGLRYAQHQPTEEGALEKAVIPNKGMDTL